MRIAIVAGEESGDILGAGLIKALKTHYPDCIFEGIGGNRMIAEGFQTLYPIDRLSVMGLIEPLKRIRELLGIRKSLRQRYIENPPEIFIGIDSPDFNLSLEESLKKQNILTAHYVSPSVWAWRQGRIKKIRRAVDLMMVLFPHEEAFYQKHGVDVVCVGHALADQIPLKPDTNLAKQQLGLNTKTRYIALLPGSRSAEVRYLWKIFLQAAQQCFGAVSDLEFIVPAANSARKQEIVEVIAEFPHLPVHVYEGRSHECMLAADVVVLASGTSTLEAMLLKKPMVITYKMAWLSYAILSRLVKVKHIGLPNLLAGKPLVPEIIQKNVTCQNIYQEVMSFLGSPNKNAELQEEYCFIHQQLRRNANVMAAGSIAEIIAAGNHA